MSQHDWDELEKEKQNIIAGKSITRLWTTQDILEQSADFSENGEVCITEADALRILEAIRWPDSDYNEYDIIGDMINECALEEEI
jgi:hypothetical protein